MSTDPEQIRQDIERTRSNLSYDVNALADEANPKNIAQRQADKAVSGVRRGAQNLKERIMGSDDDDQYGYTSADSYSTDPSVADRAKGAAQQTGQAISDTADQAKHMAQQAPQQVRQQTRGNPLAAGLVAFGLGALIGSLIPSTEAERAAVGAAKEKAGPAIEEAKEMARDAIEQVKPAVQEAGESLKQAAVDAKDSVVEQAGTARDHTVEQGEVARDHLQSTQQTGQPNPGY